MLAEETSDLVRDVTDARVRDAPSDRDVENGEALHADIDPGRSMKHQASPRGKFSRIPRGETVGFWY
jgi:hypothetical protein